MSDISIITRNQNDVGFRKNNMLKLVLKHKWYDMIESGVKPEEYREIKESIVGLLFNWRDSGFDRLIFTDILYEEGSDSTLWKYLKPFDSVEFYRGYSKGRKTMIHKIDSVGIGKANPEWSENWPGKVFIIKLCKR